VLELNEIEDGGPIIYTGKEVVKVTSAAAQGKRI
jgi:hypothetical protein